MTARLTARQAVLASLAASSAAAAGGNCKKRPVGDEEVDESSDEGGSEWEGRRTKAVVQKKAKLNDKGKAKAKNKGKSTKVDSAGRSKADKAADDDIEMEDVGVGGGDVVAYFAAMADRLQEQLQRVQDAKAKAEHVFELKAALPPPESNRQHNRMQEVERHARVWCSMVTRDANTQVHDSSVRATSQLEAVVKKMQAIADKIKDIDHNEEAKLSLEDLPEPLWMSTAEGTGGFGLGAYLGFVPSIESLAPVSTSIRALTQQRAMHPIVELDRSPKANTINKWTGRSSAPLRECRVFRVNHRPTVTLVQLLERLAGVVESVELLCPPKEPEYDKKGREKPRHDATDMQWRRGEFKKVKYLPSIKVFSRLQKVSVNSVWTKLVEDRSYSWPALLELSTVSVTMAAPLSWIAKAEKGLTSLDLMVDKDDPSCKEKVEIDKIAKAIKDTPSAKSLASLSGRVHHNLSAPAADEGFIALMGSDMGGPLHNIQMILPDIRTTDMIKALHKFRSSCVAEGAREDYRGGFTDGEGCMGGVKLRLPLSGAVAPLADAQSTLETCCQQAETVTLPTRTHHARDNAAAIVPAASFACPSAHTLTIEFCGGQHPLPQYLLNDPAAMLPRVASIEVKQKVRCFCFALSHVALRHMVAVGVLTAAADVGSRPVTVPATPPQPQPLTDVHTPPHDVLPSLPATDTYCRRGTLILVGVSKWPANENHHTPQLYLR
ncbi:unnamed protein product [Vitrella brassicaformis CCMP3155]|uniref:Uncharacterized protein n=1 Tax=Vitrella brassicaformis (strain CCMP3155) TaxID=1169540 RepID=A0A0G4GTJ5_VITBC|nr:unnamed protein product [Vitrella brassicaformis CCMP3155]|eukprot:CEM34069.1 unnamed protein product [Vitrella brassicaformis CCMP3155]